MKYESPKMEFVSFSTEDMMKVSGDQLGDNALDLDLFESLNLL